MQYREYSEADLAGVIAICVAEGWPSFPENPARAHRALTAPGATAVVAPFAQSRSALNVADTYVDEGMDVCAQ